MCDGLTSSRIRHEVEHLPPMETVYPESLFREIREFLFHARYVEFYGGEPFLVPAHLRVLDLLMDIPPQDRPALFVNTNATLLTERIKRYLEELPFRIIAISLDGMTRAINAKVRVGVDQDAVLRHIDYFCGYARRKRVRVVFNVTETRQNWFEIPDIFRFAARMDIFVHINHCIFPDHCVLYTLEPSQLGFVLKRLTRERRLLRRAGALGASADSYEFLLKCLRENFTRRQGGQDCGDESACGVAVEPCDERFDGRLAMPGVEWVSSRGEEYLKEFLDDLPRGIPWADRYSEEFGKHKKDGHK
jgi:MoaA/NifB/PqqE/SkfB family radical SAM enzyme